MIDFLIDKLFYNIWLITGHFFIKRKKRYFYTFFQNNHKLIKQPDFAIIKLSTK